MKTVLLACWDKIFNCSHFQFRPFSLPQTSVTETSAPELANLLFWLMVVGYSIHNIEVFFDMERIFGAPELVTFHGSQSQTSEAFESLMHSLS
uniref:Uncharacterized protein n=2 Tax=Musa acuminata subsp. malaccensis TaxID=214687 RepID=A0A804L542_MUSAM